MRHVLLMFLLICGPLIACAPRQAEQASKSAETAQNTTFEQVSPSQARQLRQNTPGLKILDVRTAEEFAAGHLDQAQSLDFYAPDFQARLGQLDRQQPWLMYCQSGRRSAKVLELMKSLGFEKVYELQGGFSGWQAAGQAVSR
jgi:rhodanese-related sulfurtransferase